MTKRYFKTAYQYWMYDTKTDRLVELERGRWKMGARIYGEWTGTIVIP